MAKLMAAADRPSPVGNGATCFGLFDNNSFSDEGFMNWDATILLEVYHLTQRCTHDILEYHFNLETRVITIFKRFMLVMLKLIVGLYWLRRSTAR